MQQLFIIYLDLSNNTSKNGRVKRGGGRHLDKHFLRTISTSSNSYFYYVWIWTLGFSKKRIESSEKGRKEEANQVDERRRGEEERRVQEERRRGDEEMMVHEERRRGEEERRVQDLAEMKEGYQFLELLLTMR